MKAIQLFIPKINATPGFVYIDPDQYIEYIFFGFEKPLTTEERLAFIQQYGTPRKSSLESIIQGDGWSYDMGEPALEHQVIVRPPA